MNEHGPVFAQVSYQAMILEDHAVGDSIGLTVSATDQEGHSIAYSIDSHGDYFDIGSSSGEISLARSLDSDPPTNHNSFFLTVMWSSSLVTLMFMLHEPLGNSNR